jgi:hypothetical protein
MLQESNQKTVTYFSGTITEQVNSSLLMTPGGHFSWEVSVLKSISGRAETEQLINHFKC